MKIVRFACLAMLITVSWCEESMWEETKSVASNFINSVEDKLESEWDNYKPKSLKFFTKFLYALDGRDNESVSLKKTYEKWTSMIIKKDDHVRKVAGLNACECKQYSCGCCQHLEEPTIHLNSNICMNVTYLSEDYGISMTVTVNNYTLFNETVSVRNPPPFCLGVPYVKEWAEACVRLYDIDATKSSLHACIKAEARMKHVLIAEYDFGCFDIGPYSTKHGFTSERTEPFVVLL